VRNEEIVDQFGRLSVNVLWPIRLLVPTAKSLDSGPAAPVAPAVDHFTCYRVGAHSTFTPHTMTVQDQFGTATVTLTRPTRLCVPTDKDGEQPGAENNIPHLMCYRIKAPVSTPMIGRVFTNNQFGPGIVYPLRRKELCVPAAKIK